MARITVEDCLQHVANRFELVALASRRARQIADGTHMAMVDEENDKPTVIALREIAAGIITNDFLDRQQAEEEEEELAAVEHDNEETDLIAEEIKQMLSKGNDFNEATDSSALQENDSDMLGFQPENKSNTKIILDDDDELLG